MKNKINTIHGNREASDLVFQGKVEKQWEESMGGLKIRRKESIEETKKLAITDIDGIGILDESGRGLGKMGAWAIGGMRCFLDRLVFLEVL